MPVTTSYLASFGRDLEAPDRLLNILVSPHNNFIELRGVRDLMNVLTVLILLDGLGLEDFVVVFLYVFLVLDKYYL